MLGKIRRIPALLTDWKKTANEKKKKRLIAMWLPHPQAFFIKERSAYLNLKVKECYTQFLHFSRFFFPYFFLFFTELRSCVNGCWLRTRYTVNSSFIYRSRVKLNWRKWPYDSIGEVWIRLKRGKSCWHTVSHMILFTEREQSVFLSRSWHWSSAF